MIFTPRVNEKSNSRAKMDISAYDDTKVLRGTRNKGWTAVVTDRATGLRYEVKGAPCDLPNCFCDAVIVKLV